jgi:hypothetical protein
MAYPPPAPPPPPPGGPNKPRLRGHTGIRVGAVLSIIGLGLLIAGIVVLAAGSLGKVNNFQRVRIADGTGTVHFAHSGGYVAYYEASDVTDSDNERIPLVRVRLTSPSGTAMTLNTLYGGNTNGTIKKLTYDYNGHRGAALYQFHIDETGTYQVQLAALNTPADAQIAFGTSIATGTFLGGGLTGLGVLLLIAGLIVLIVGLVRRRNHKKQLYAYGTGYGGVPPGYPPPAYPGTYGTAPQQQYPGYPPQGQPPAQPGPPSSAYPPPGYTPSQQQPPPDQQAWQPPTSLDKPQQDSPQQDNPWPPRDDQ